MTSRTSRRSPRSVVAALALTLAVGGGVSALAAWPAGATSASVPAAALAASTRPTQVPLKLQAGQAPKPVTMRPVVSGTCATVRAHLRQYAARRIRAVGCTAVTTGTAPAPALTTRQLAVPMAAVNPLCASEVQTWVINRERFWNSALINSKNGEVMDMADAISPAGMSFMATPEAKAESRLPARDRVVRYVDAALGCAQTADTSSATVGFFFSMPGRA